MKSHLPRFASNTGAFFIAGALLVGCASGGYQVAPSGSALQRAVPLGLNTDALAKPFTSPLGGEVFTASNVTVRPKCSRNPHTTRFSGSGATSGPYPGTFVASGSWRLGLGGFPPKPYWGFSEFFTITSGTRTISGSVGGNGSGFPSFITCKTFGPVAKRGTLLYHSRIDGIHYSGPATIRIIESGPLGEMLRR
jgi:hypothetical protein